MTSKKYIIREILTGISLVGCFLNMLALVHDLYLFSNKDYFLEWTYLITISCTTLLCLYGILKLREGELNGFKFYLFGQVGEFLFYLLILIFVTIPEYSERVEMDNYLATVGFVKNATPLVLMTVLNYLYVRKLRTSPN